jgi:asparagine synthase (glutamine-hydrolysing)
LRTLYPDEVFKYTDRLTTAFGLKHRSPFVDYQLTDLAVRIPAKYRRQGRQLKPLLKRALVSRLPARILQGDNPGFSLPYDIWLKGPFRDLAHDLLCSSRFRERGYFDPAAISKIVANVVDSPSTPVTFGEVYRVWDLMMLELWFRIYVDRHAQSEADLPSL